MASYLTVGNAIKQDLVVDCTASVRAGSGWRSPRLLLAHGVGRKNVIAISLVPGSFPRYSQ